jgi:hypothetical protein
MLTHALLYSSSGDPGPDEQHAGGVRRRDRVHVQTRNDAQGLLQGLWSSMEVSTPTRSCQGTVSKLYFSSLKLNSLFLKA